MGMPQPPKKKGSITEQDIAEILEENLLPEHHENPYVLMFINSYIGCRNNVQAAKDAGLSTRQGRTLLNRPDIHKTICKITETAVFKYGLDPDEIVERVKDIAYVDPVAFQNEDGSGITNLHELPPEVRRAIKKFKIKNLWEKDINGIKQIVGEVIEIELHDKLKSVEMLGREKNLFKETTVFQHDVTSNMKDILLESRKRAEQKVLESRHPEIVDVNTKEG